MQTYIRLTPVYGGFGAAILAQQRGDVPEQLRHLRQQRERRRHLHPQRQPHDHEHPAHPRQRLRARTDPPSISGNSNIHGNALGERERDDEQPGSVTGNVISSTGIHRRQRVDRRERDRRRTTITGVSVAGTPVPEHDLADSRPPSRSRRSRQRDGLDKAGYTINTYSGADRLHAGADVRREGRWSGQLRGAHHGRDAVHVQQQQQRDHQRQRQPGDHHRLGDRLSNQKSNWNGAVHDEERLLHQHVAATDVPARPSGASNKTVSTGNNTSFNSYTQAFFYSPCTVTMNNQNNFAGQVMGGTVEHRQPVHDDVPPGPRARVRHRHLVPRKTSPTCARSNRSLPASDGRAGRVRAMSDAWVRALVALPFGLVVGSFLTVVVGSGARKKESVVSPRVAVPALRRGDRAAATTSRSSRGCCSAAGVVLCRARYPGASTRCSRLGTAALFVGVAPSYYLGVYIDLMLCAFCAMMPAVCVIDIGHRIIPNRLTYPALIGFPVYDRRRVGVPRRHRTRPGVVGASCSTGEGSSWSRDRARGMGMGDVKLAALIGMVMGSLGLRYVGVAAGAAILLGGVGGIVALARGAGPQARDPVRARTSRPAPWSRRSWASRSPNWYLRALPDPASSATAPEALQGPSRPCRRSTRRCLTTPVYLVFREHAQQDICAS